MSKSTDRKPRFELIRMEDPGGVSLVRLPGKHEHHRYVGHVYVVELSDGTVKVGKTANPIERIGKHATVAALYDFKIVRLWLSIAHRNPAEVEKLLIAYGRRSRSRRVREEYFKNLDFAEIVRFANGVGYQPVDLAEIAETRRLEYARPPFGEASLAEDVDPLTTVQGHVASFFGRRSDGSYDAPIVFKSGSAADLRAVLEQVAEAKGRPVEDVLSMTWLDMLEGLITQVVRTEAMKLQSHAIGSGRAEILETTGEALARLQLVEER